MARVARLAGAILAETEGRYFLVGNPKEPCDFARAGFAPPPEIDAVARPWVALSVTGAVAAPAPALELAVEGEALAQLLVDRFVIERNGSVSERLWRIVVEAAPSGGELLDARWLGEVPAAVWRIVRDTVLRCT